MDKPVEPENEKPEPQNAKTTFTLKCYPEDAEALKNAQKICGPGYLFGKKLHALVDAAGLSPKTIKDFEEIVLLRTNISQVLDDAKSQANVLLDGLQVQLRQKSTLLEKQSSEIQKSRQDIENELSANQLQISDLTKRLDGFCQQNAALVGEKEAMDKLIRLLEDQISERNARIQSLQNLAEEKTREVKALADKFKSLSGKLQEAESKTTALQVTFEKLKTEERLSAQKNLMEQLAAERSRGDAQLSAEKEELKKIYESRIADLGRELSELRVRFREK